MNGSQLLKSIGVLSLTVMLTVLALDGVDNTLVAMIVMAVVGIVAPDVAEELDWGPF